MVSNPVIVHVWRRFWHPKTANLKSHGYQNLLFFLCFPSNFDQMIPMIPLIPFVFDANSHNLIPMIPLIPFVFDADSYNLIPMIPLIPFVFDADSCNLIPMIPLIPFVFDANSHNLIPMIPLIPFVFDADSCNLIPMIPYINPLCNPIRFSAYKVSISCVYFCRIFDALPWGNPLPNFSLTFATTSLIICVC